MRKIWLVLFAAFVATIAADVRAGPVDEKHLIEKAQKDLQEASIWLIREGILTYRNSEKKGLHRKLIDEWRVLIWTDPWIESERFLDAFWIKTRGIYYSITNFHRESLPSGVYEFWVIKIDGKEWSGVGSAAKFYVTRADNIYAERRILETSDTFIEEYAVNDETSIKFPTENPRLLYELEAWKYPEHFGDSDIKNIRARIREDGSIELTRIEPRSRN